MTVSVYLAPSGLPVGPTRWVPDWRTVSAPALFSRAPHVWAQAPVLTCSLTADLIDKSANDTLDIWAAQLAGGGALAYLYDPSRGKRSYHPYHADEGFRVSPGYWIDGDGTLRQWQDDDTSQHLWADAMLVDAAAAESDGTVDVSGLAVGAVVRRGDAIKIDGYRYVVRADSAPADAGGVATVALAPVLQAALAGGEAVEYPADHGLFALTGWHIGEADAPGDPKDEKRSYRFDFVEVDPALYASPGLTYRVESVE